MSNGSNKVQGSRRKVHKLAKVHNELEWFSWFFSWFTSMSRKLAQLFVHFLASMVLVTLCVVMFCECDEVRLSRSVFIDEIEVHES